MLKDNLKSLRESKGLTKKQIADAIGVTERAYITYEYGQRDVSTETLSKLADFYHVTTDYLLGREPAAPQTPLDEFAQRENLEALEKKLIEKYLRLNDRNRAAVMAFLRACVAESEAELTGEVCEYETYTAEEYQRLPPKSISDCGKRKPKKPLGDIGAEEKIATANAVETEEIHASQI